MQQKDKIALALGIGITAWMLNRPKQAAGTKVNAVISRANATPLSAIPVTVGGSSFSLPTSTISQIWSGLTGLFTPKPTSESVIDTFASGGISTADLPSLDFPMPNLSAGSSPYSLLG